MQPPSLEAWNAWLDGLPRPRVGRLHREAPTFRTCGVAGFYAALVVVVAGGLVTGLSLLVLATVAAVSALSFFAWALLRRWITGRETLVLLEHVWIALACTALTVWALGAPLRPYLDVVGVALCAFLAAGRIGCLLVGCCHGLPSSFGITYGPACARDGFPAHLVGVRLFPVQAVEAAALVAIGTAGFVGLAFAGPGLVFAWVLLAYAIVRFGLEGLRGDRRPEWLGLSQNRWMCLAEVMLALWVTAPDGPALALLGLFVLAIGLVLARHLHAPARRLLAAAHVASVRDLALRDHGGQTVPVAATTAEGVSVVVSGAPPHAHVSLSLPDGDRDLPLLCVLAARALPELCTDFARVSAAGVLHLVPSEETATPPLATDATGLSRALFGAVLRHGIETVHLTVTEANTADGRSNYFAPRMPHVR